MLFTKPVFLNTTLFFWLLARSLSECTWVKFRSFWVVRTGVQLCPRFICLFTPSLVHLNRFATEDARHDPAQGVLPGV